MKAQGAGNPVDGAAIAAQRLLGRTIAVAGMLIPSLGAWWRRRARADRARGIGEYALGNVAEAIAAMQSALAKDRHNADYYCDLGHIHYETGGYGPAKQCFRAALGLDYHNARARKGLAFTLQAVGEYDEAAYLYLQLLHDDPHDADVVLNLGVVLHNSGRYDEAVEYYEQAEKLDPRNPDIPENRGRALYTLGRIEEAVACLRRSLELNADNSEAYGFLGLALEAEGNKAEALESYYKALERDADAANVHMDVARLLGARGDYATAVQHSAIAARIFEERGDAAGLAWAHWDLGWHYYTLGDYARSIAESTKALEFEPAQYAARFNLALALLHDGRAREAADEYRKGAEAVSLASDLEHWAIDDLREALQKRPDLPGGADILEDLRAKYEALRRQHGVVGEPAAAP